MCLANRYQNGDLDFDGIDYVPNTWPNGTRNHPTAFQYAGPFQASGKPYPQIQFETDVGGSEALCNTATGVGCTVPPTGAKFYPFWSLSPQSSAVGSHLTSCVWNFGNVLPSTIPDLRQGRPVRHSQRGPVRRHDHQRGPAQPRVRRSLRRSHLTVSGNSELSPGVPRLPGGAPLAR